MGSSVCMLILIIIQVDIIYLIGNILVGRYMDSAHYEQRIKYELKN